MTTPATTLTRIAHEEFGDVVAAAEIVAWSQQRARVVRIRLNDGSYIDVRTSSAGDYAVHWEHRMVDGWIHRWDNAPHHPEVATHPHHVHDGQESQVTDSELPHENIAEAFRFVMNFAAETIRRNASRA